MCNIISDNHKGGSKLLCKHHHATRHVSSIVLLQAAKATTGASQREIPITGSTNEHTSKKPTVTSWPSAFFAVGMRSEAALNSAIVLKPGPYS
jgi:hypothetical protein